MNNHALLDNQYRVETRLGSGGGGTVYKAWHVPLQRHVAIKGSKSSAVQGCAQAQRNEFEALENVRNRYLPQVYGFVSESSGAYIVMEYIEGESFGNLLGRGCRFSRTCAVKWYGQLASALEGLHRQNICHRDIKPANIMMKPDGDICLIDFGAASINGNSPKFVSRSLGYASPEQCGLYEQIERTRVISAASLSIDWKLSDIYSLGAAMYHIITGKRPHERADEVIPIRKLGRYGTGIARIIEKSMRPEPSKRYASATELAKAIERL